MTFVIRKRIKENENVPPLRGELTILNRRIPTPHFSSYMFLEMI